MEQFILPHQHGQSRDQLMNNIPSTENFQILADIFKQLSDTTRIRIFWILCHCEECVINISAIKQPIPLPVLLKSTDYNRLAILLQYRLIEHNNSEAS